LTDYLKFVWSPLESKCFEPTQSSRLMLAPLGVDRPHKTIPPRCRHGNRLQARRNAHSWCSALCSSTTLRLPAIHVRQLFHLAVHSFWKMLIHLCKPHHLRKLPPLKNGFKVRFSHHHYYLDNSKRCSRIKVFDGVSYMSIMKPLANCRQKVDTKIKHRNCACFLKQVFFISCFLFETEWYKVARTSIQG
jgi:hypothetical protein